MKLQVSSTIGDTVAREPEPVVDLLRRIRAEYGEMPGLRLSIDQATRLWSMDRDVCNLLLTALLETGYLALDRNGRYMRAHSGY